MIKIIFILTILFYLSNRVKPLEIPIITNIQDVIGLAHDVGDIASGNIPFKNFFNPVANPIDEVLDKLDDITEQIENLDTKLDDLLANLIARIPLEDQINTDIRELQQHISTIDEVYDEFLAYSQNISLYDDDTLEDYVVYVTNTRNGNLLNILNMIFNIIVPKKTALARIGFLENMMQKRKIMDPLEMCNPQVSFQNRLLQIYNLVSLTELRAFLMTTFGFRLKMELRSTRSVGEFKRAQSSFVMRLDQYLIEFKRVMQRASREIFLCDPETLINKNTYVEFEGLFTAIVLNEQQGDENCWTSCSEFSGWSHSDCYSFSGQHYCPKHPCRGHFGSCGWIGGDVDLCEYHESFMKRYVWVRSYSNGWYGQDTICHNSTYHQVHGKQNRFFYCDTCICKCEESDSTSKAIRTFSLRPQVSNIDENKVISDVKFTLKDKVIHIQIEESPLLPIGQLDKNESSWVPLEDFMYFEEFADGIFIQKKDNEYLPFERDIDYAFIRGDQKILFLDEISGGPNFVLTGVQLNHEVEQKINSTSENKSPIQLKIRVTPFDYASGKLTPTEKNPSVWLTSLTQPKLPSAYAKERTEIAKNAAKVYNFENAVNPPNLKPNQYIRFKQSSIFSDAGQSTIPFMDSRPAASSNSLAFDGLGLAYRGHKDFGGFVILKAMTIDVTNYMDALMTAEQRKYYMQTTRQPVANTPPKKRRKSRRRN